MPSPRVLVTRPSLVLAVADSVLFAVWTKVAGRPEDLLACLPLALQQAKALKQCGLVVALHPEQPLPDGPFRDVIKTEMRKLDPYLLCGATVLLRGGLLGTAMRAVVSTLQLLSRTTHPERIVASGAEAARFVHDVLVRQLDKAPSEKAIAEGYEELTKRVWSAP